MKLRYLKKRCNLYVIVYMMKNINFEGFLQFIHETYYFIKPEIIEIIPKPSN